MYVFDSCILVAALRSRRGASFLFLSAIRQRVITGVLSEALFLEYSDVLKRDQNLQQFWTTREEIE
ncbi:MAG: PIN domain-containing protein [Rhizonema sp. NSF051]|nr:PIN domain-containing protein [Rhizonema sp. NSF051]